MLKKIKNEKCRKEEIFDRFEYYIDDEDTDVKITKLFYKKNYKCSSSIEKFLKLMFKNNKIEFLAEETWFKNGKKHRDGDLPAEIGYFEDGNFKRRSWMKNGKIYREDDKPAVEFYHGVVATFDELQKFYKGSSDLINELQELQWYKDGELGRDNDLPSVIDYYDDGKLKIEQWFKNGEKHRDGDLPSIIDYYKNGSLNIKVWYRNGQMHRENDLPARIDYYKNGSIKAEYWCKNDNLYRENSKPTYRAYNYKSGTVKEEKYDTGIKLYQLR